MLSAVFINNYVLSRFLGICPFLGVSKKLNQATGMSLAVIFVMLIATAVTWPIQTYLLDPNNLGYLQTIVFILVIASLVQLVEIVMKKMMRLSKFNEVKPTFEKWRIIKEFICLSKEKINFLSKHFSFTYIKTIKDEITKNIMLTHKKEERNVNTKMKIDHSIDKEFANNVKYI